MNTQVDDATRCVLTLISALRALLEAASIVQANHDQIASAIFLATELAHAVERLAAMLSVISPANDAS